ncbi:hypothetical protein [Streptomyces sp. NPDC004008]
MTAMPSFGNVTLAAESPLAACPGQHERGGIQHQDDREEQAVLQREGG